MAVDRGTAISQTLLLEGFEELAKDFKAAGNDARKEFRDSLKPIGKVVAGRAAIVASAKGLIGKKPHGDYTTGQLVKKLRQAGAVSVANKGVTVTAKATRNGYPYPSIYEYGRGGARAFLEPALMQTQGEVMQMTEDWINTFLSKHNL